MTTPVQACTATVIEGMLINAPPLVTPKKSMCGMFATLCHVHNWLH